MSQLSFPTTGTDPKVAEVADLGKFFSSVYASNLTPIIPSLSYAPFVPEFRSATGVLTIPRDCLLLMRNEVRHIVQANTDIDTTNGGALTSSARKVFFNSVTSTFDVKAWSATLNDSEIATHHLIAIIRVNPASTLLTATRVFMACEVTVDGIYSSNQSSVLCPIILPQAGGFIPNLDTAANTLYIPSDVIIKSSGNIEGKATGYATTASATIDLSAVASSAKLVFYSISSGAYVVKNWNNNLTGVEVSDLLLVAVVRRSGGTGNSLSMNCTCTVDNTDQLASYAFKQTEWAAIFSPLGGGPTPTTNLPSYNTASKTLTFYPDTIFVSGSKRWILSAGASITLSGSSANRVFWDTAANALVFKAWSTNLTSAEAAKYVLVAGVRDSSASNVPPVISIMCPYTVDGRLLGYIPEYATSGAENRAGAALEGIHHRGFSAVAPENTLAAYRASAAANNYPVEGDVHWTSDGVAVLLHDSTIDRTSNGTGAISGMTLATAKTFDFGSWKGSVFSGERIPTWDEYLVLANKLDLFGYFEIKTDATLPQIQGLLSGVENAGMKGRVQFDSFFLSALQKIVAEDPTQDVGHLIGGLDDANWTAAIATAVTLQTGQNKVAIEPPITNLTKARVEEAHRAGLRVVVYTINGTAQVVTLADMGVDGIMTDALNIAQVIRDNEL